MRAKQGFSLIELLLVVAIILIIAAIAIASVMRSRIAANESAAVAALRTINVAEATFASTYNSGYSEDLRRLAAPGSGSASVTAADLLDPVLSANAPGSTGPNSFVRKGYVFPYTPTGNSTTFGWIFQYQVNADPQTRNSTGRRSYYSDQSSIVRANASAEATSSDNPM
jgi:prepilin-type N-terminal cleavage/methylation domain-containing protein